MLTCAPTLISGDHEVTASPPVVLDARVVTGAGGGPDKTILNSPNFLAQDGYRMVCAYLHPRNDPGFDHLRAKARASHAHLISVIDRGPWDWKVITQLLEICRREQVRIWHGHDYKSNALGLILRRFWPMHLVSTVHGWVTHTRRTPIYYAIDRFCLRRYDHVFAVSADLHEQCLTSGVPASRCMLLENGIDLSDYTSARDPREARQQLGLPPNRILIGAVGRLSAEKGFDILIRAVDRLIHANNDVALVIAGEGKEDARLRHLIDELGQTDRIRLLGYHPDLRLLYQAMDIFALSSLREGLPNALLEAMAMELPVVATRVGGVPNLLRNGENGLLVQPANVDELTAALNHLLADSNLRTTLASRARETVSQNHSFNARMQKIARVYDSLLNRDPLP